MEEQLGMGEMNFFLPYFFVLVCSLFSLPAPCQLSLVSWLLYHVVLRNNSVILFAARSSADLES